MKTRHQMVTVLVAAVMLFTGTALLYAHCGECAADAKALGDSLMGSKMTLAPAVLLAEKHSKGVAVKAVYHGHADEGIIEVHCVSGDKLMAVAVNAKSGEVASIGEVATFDDHAAVETRPPGEGMSDADIQTKLDEATVATRAGKFDEAAESLKTLDELTDLTASARSKIETARAALDAAKAAKDIKGKLPGLP